MQRRIGMGILLILTLGIVTACSGRGTAASLDPVSHGGDVTNYVSLVDALRAEGVTVEPAGTISQPFFSVEGQAITVNGEQVQVFEFADAAAASAAAQDVSPDGSSVGTSMMTWVAPPHFYKTDKLIVLYIGENEAVLAALESVVGEQIAGR